MTESIKNVEITEQKPATPPNTPDKSPANTIKERLNLHVKRRLQQEIPNQEQSLQQQQQFNSTTSNSFANNKNLESMLNKHSDKQVKTRKCCQKRKTEKTSPDGTAVRKCKRNKTKQSLNSPVGNTDDDVNCAVISAITDILPSCSAPVGSGNADGDGDGHDGETKSVTLREKDRGADVLGMVLSAKKNALIQHPNVQAFLQQVTDAIKS